MQPAPSAWPRPNPGYDLPILLCLAACALEQGLKATPGDGSGTPEDPTETAEDSVVDSEAPPETAERGDTADTADTPPPCSGTSAILTIDSLGTQASPYATLLVADLDGGGTPDVVHESWAAGRGVAFLRGEDIRAGSTVPAAFWPQRIETGQASLAVGPAGDLDGDGLGELLLGQGEDGGPDGRLDVWSPATGSSLGALVVADLPAGGFVFPPRTPAPDLDGDSLPEVVVVLAEQGASVPELLVVSASVLAGARSDGAVFRGVRAGDFVRVRRRWRERRGGGPPRHGRQRSFGRGEETRRDGRLRPDRRGGEHARAEALAALKGGGAALPVVGPDLDGDGVADLLAMAETKSGDSKPPLSMDATGDGYEELYMMRQTDDESRVLGYSGVDVLSSAASGIALLPDDATFRLDGTGSDYLGANLTAYSDDTCAPGLVASAHFDDTVYFVPNTLLKAGGVISVATLDARTRRADWYGYFASGGQDVDGDGSLDLITGGMDGGMMDLLLGVGWM